MSDPASPRGSARGVGLLLVFATALLSGVATFVNLYAVRGTSSDAFVTARNALVALLLLPIGVLLLRRSARPLTASDWGRLGVIGVVGGAVPFLLFFHGLQLATSAGGGATASFFYRTLFLMATVLGVVALGERLPRRTAMAAALLLGGNALLLSLTSPVWTDGTAYVVAATALWAVEYTISKRAVRDLPGPTVALGRMGIGAVALFGYLAATGEVGGVGALTIGQWTWVGISAALLLGFVLTWYSGLRTVDLGVAASVLVLGFPVTWLLSVAVRGGAVLPWAAVGAAVVTGGALLAVGRSGLTELARSLVRRPAPTPAA